MNEGSFPERHPVLTGFMLAALMVPLHAIIPFWWSHHVAALVLVLLFGIGLGTSVASAGMLRIMMEFALAVSALVFAAATVIHHPVWLPAGYLACGVWSLFKRQAKGSARLPSWYLPFSATYSLLAGAGIWLVWLWR